LKKRFRDAGVMDIPEGKFKYRDDLLALKKIIKDFVIVDYLNILQKEKDAVL
jgi:hypothetical protein